MLGVSTKPSPGPNQERWKRVRHIVLDMDGTIYLGGRLFAETLPFLATLEELGIGWDFLTSSNSKSRADYVESLGLMGIVVEAEQVVMSTYACVATLRGDFPEVRRIFVLGTPGMKKDLEDAGFGVVKEILG